MVHSPDLNEYRAEEGKIVPYYIPAEKVTPEVMEWMAEQSGGSLQFNTIYFPLEEVGFTFNGRTVNMTQRTTDSNGQIREATISIEDPDIVFRPGRINVVAPISQVYGQPQRVEFFTFSSDEVGWRNVKVGNDSSVDQDIVTAAHRAKDRVLVRREEASEKVRTRPPAPGNNR